MRNTSLTQSCERQSAIDVKNLCSRKLFELLTTDKNQLANRQQLRSVERELVTRRHYLQELGRLRVSS